MGQEGLVVFVKNPELGKVKTRIAATTGDQEALRIYLELLSHTQRIVSKLHCNRYVYYTDHIPSQDLWPSDQYQKRIQPTGDLGQKMSAAISDVLLQCDKALLIGSDCASLTTEHLQQAMELLQQSDIVLGPTFDGGYYLIGMKEHHPQLFSDISWSTDEVYAQTVAKAQSMGLSVASLATLSDIDYEKDWLQYGW